MSFDINWTNLVSDDTINDVIKEFLDQQFQSLSLPSFINNLSVTDFSLGSQPPDITIRHIGDPFDEFYKEENESDDPVTLVPLERQGSDFTNDDDDDSSDDSDFNDTINNTKSNVLDESKILLPSPLKTRVGLDSIFQLNSNHNYNMMNVGLGNLNSSSTHTGNDTPTNIFSQNPYNNLRNTSTNSKLYTMKKPQVSRNDNDIQFIVEIDYHGDLHIGVTVNLLVNYPSSNFITLPIKLHISDLVIHSIAAIAYLKNSVYFSFLCDINETNPDYFSTQRSRSTSATNASAANINSGGNFVEYITAPINRERIDIIKKVRIESEIGEVENNVLRNVGKVERFLSERLRSIIRDEIAWPGWVCFDLNQEDSDDEEDVETPSPPATDV